MFGISEASTVSPTKGSLPDDCDASWLATVTGTTQIIILPLQLTIFVEKIWTLGRSNWPDPPFC